MKWSIRYMIAAAVCSASTLASAHEPTRQDSSPVLTVALAPFDTMVPNVQHLARLGGGGMAAGMVKTGMTQYTAGLDTSRPVGVFVELDESGNPTPVAALPLKDLEEFFGQLSIFGEPDDLGDGLYEMNVGNSIYMKKSGDWLVVGQTEDAVLDFDVKSTDALKGLVAKYDILIDLHPNSIPAPLVEMVMSQIEAGMQQGLANMDEEEAKVAEANSALAMKQFREGIEGTESLKIGIAVNKSQSNTIIDIGTKFVADSKLANNLKKFKSAKSMLSGIPQETSMMSMQLLQLVAAEDIDQLKTTIDSSIQAALKQLDNESEAEKAKEFFTKVGELFLESAKEGQLESAADVTVGSNLNITGAFSVSDGKKVESLAAEAAKEIAKESKGAASLKVNTGKHGGANLHLLTVAMPPEADEKAVKVFGKNVTISLATTPKVVYFAAGKDAESVIKSTIDRAAAKTSAAGEALKARFAMGQLLKFMQSVDSNPALDAAVEVVAEGKDKVSIDSKIGERDSVIRITMEDNVIKTISAASQAGRTGGGF